MTAQPIEPDAEQVGFVEGVSRGTWRRDRFEPADSAEELIVTKPFDVRLPARDTTP
ncbi:hypothetical protein [Micromonospora sp. LOL_024]|uniref:hypothetical protein n=1 Tax=Micromonospora sp. LOL_024 TaxID=3345412 RepID=UPI003A89F14A